MFGVDTIIKNCICEPIQMCLAHPARSMVWILGTCAPVFVSFGAPGAPGDTIAEPIGGDAISNWNDLYGSKRTHHRTMEHSWFMWQESAKQCKQGMEHGHFWLNLLHHFEPPHCLTAAKLCFIWNFQIAKFGDWMIHVQPTSWKGGNAVYLKNTTYLIPFQRIWVCGSRFPTRSVPFGFVFWRSPLPRWHWQESEAGRHRRGCWRRWQCWDASKKLVSTVDDVKMKRYGKTGTLKGFIPFIFVERLSSVLIFAPRVCL